MIDPHPNVSSSGCATTTSIVPTNGDTNDVNVLGHTHVADRLRPDDAAHALGAVLPDLATIAGVRLQTPLSSSLQRAITDGVACHPAADATFPSLAPVRSGVAALRRDLLAAGLPTGPARAVAHVGYELLLDGTLVGTPTEHAYRRALTGAADATDAIAIAHRARWRAFVDRITANAHHALRYDDVGWVADRLVAVLDHRPRLRLDAGDVPAVARVLDRHAGAIRGDAPHVLASTFAARHDG
jgi:hypothetical protein